MSKRNEIQIDEFRERQLLTIVEHETEIMAKANSLDDVVGKIFQIMRKQIYKEIDGPIIHIETKEVYFKNVRLKKETEKFLFFFMPREKTYFTITARIILEIKYLNIKKEDF